MRRKILGSTLMVFTLILFAGCGWFGDEAAVAQPEPSPTSTMVPDPAPSPTPTVMPAPTPLPTATPVTPSTGGPHHHPEHQSTPVSHHEVITIREADTSERIIALTFDAGADRGFTTEILDTLQAEGIKASFGITGAWAEANPDLVTRIDSEGHHFINHTYDHPSFTGFSTNAPPLSHDERVHQLKMTEEVMRGILNHDRMQPYFRPPYGDYDESVLTDIAQAGYTVNVMWSVDSLGWQGLTASEIANRCVEGATPGGILLFHVGAQSQDAAALPEIIQRLRNDGYRFVTVKEIVGR